MKPSWKKYLFYASLIIVGGGLIFILVETIRAKNTGFETKTLWDWLELLVIPLVLAIGAFFLNRSERAVERENEKDRQQEAALQTYLDRMAELLLKEKLRTTENEEVRDVARTRTLTVLRVLDGKRKGIVVKFLYEAKLVIGSEPIVYLVGAELQNVELMDTYLKEINLDSAYLQGANLEGVYLGNAYLRGTYLQNVNLENAILSGANLEDANLKGASLNGASLRNMKTGGATMPDGTIHALP